MVLFIHTSLTLPCFIPYNLGLCEVKAMKEKFVGLITFLLFTFLVCLSAHRLLPQKPGEEEFKDKAIIQSAFLTHTKEDFSDLMGSEDCDEKDEECVERRMIAEAHLDYIYTQHHKPKPKP